jgi:formate-dependent nitrite reductase cytochrome c552 subunit
MSVSSCASPKYRPRNVGHAQSGGANPFVNRRMDRSAAPACSCSRAAPYDPNVDASRQEMRSFVCGQCHVEYYCGPKTTLFYPWNNGLKVEQIERYYDAYKFPDGHDFYDWTHEETGAGVLKAQHPEFETWSQGIHARSGVACADCPMPYKREGAMKVSDHWVRSPLINVAARASPAIPTRKPRSPHASMRSRPARTSSSTGRPRR